MGGREPGPDGGIASTTVSVRGELVVRRAGTAVPMRPKERAVLAAIALAHPQPIGIDRIVALVWDGAAPATARKTVQNHIARIRRAIGGLVETSPVGYRFAPGVVIDRFGGPGARVALADLPDTPEIDAHRQHINAHVVAAEEQRWEAELAGGATPDLVAALHTATLTEPYRERRWYLLASTHAALGARREALRACDAARRHLAEVGLVPGEALREVEHRLLVEDPSAVAATRPVPARPVVHPHRGEPFVGRARELALLDDAWQRAGHTRTPQLVVVQGPAGSGKTRLVDEFCRRLPDDIAVLVARHRADGDQALAPVADAIRPVLDEPLPPGPEPARALARAVRGALQLVGDRPHVLVVDDAQWATHDALDVVAEAIDGVATPTLLLLTTRPQPGGEASWAPLAAVAAMHHVTIGELSRTELGALVDASGLATPPDPDLVHARTAGLPYYASELLRVARLGGALDVLDVPSAVRTWMERRLASLDGPAAETIRVAAVAGPTVDPDLLARVTGRAPEDVAASCDRLVDAGLLTSDPDAGTVRFSHELTRDAILDGLGPTTAAGFHRRIADALEATAPPALLAHHLARGGPAVAVRATDAAIESGRHELASGAWRQAEAWFRTALDLAATGDARARALAGLGRALVGSERFGESETALRAAIDLAREHGLATVQAAATLALAGRAGRGAGVAADDGEITAALRSALDHLERGADASDRERQVLTSAIERELAIMLLLEGSAGERTRLLQRQLDRARALDPPDPAELAAALLAYRYARLDGPSLTRRLADVAEVLALPAAQVGPERLLTAHCYRHEDLVRVGDRTRAAAALADAEGLGRRYPHPYWNWATRTWRVVEAIDAGDLAAAEELAFEAAGLRAGIAEATACFGVNLVNIRLYQRRTDEVLPLLRDAVETYPHIPTYRAVLALCSSEAGEPDVAARHLHHFTSAGLAGLPDDTNRQLALAVLAHTAADLDDAGAAGMLRTALEPFAGQWVVLNCYGGGGAVWGPVDHALGRLAALERHPDVAIACFDRAEQQAAGAPRVLERIRAHRAMHSLPSISGPARRRRPADRAAS